MHVDNISQKAKWKQEVRDKFRREIQEWLQMDYDFYAMRARPGVNGEEYIRHNFKEVVGKVYAPFKDERTYSLALDNSDPEGNNEAIKLHCRSFSMWSHAVWDKIRRMCCPLLLMSLRLIILTMIWHYV